jgi:hypothetical protein
MKRPEVQEQITLKTPWRSPFLHILKSCQNGQERRFAGWQTVKAALRSGAGLFCLPFPIP